MNNPIPVQRTSQRTRRGNALITFVFLLPVVFLFVGLAIDFGAAYVAKASLAKAVDASCLAGMRNYYQGTAQAQAIALAQFSANYGHPAWGASPVTPTATFSTDANNNQLLSVNAAATINTLFIRLIPQWQTLQVGANAQVTRANVIMSLALDRSGSMSGNGGGAALPGAISTFINFFDDTLDTVGMVSFSSAVANNVAIAHNFKGAITSAANGFRYSGSTFALGGLTNAYAQIASVVTPPNEQIVKVCVFFTDGHANTSQESFNIPAATLLNFGGYDSGTTVAFFDPTTGTQRNLGASAPTQFYSYHYNTMQTLVRANVTDDAQYRCVQVANAMRAHGIIVYAIGLGNSIDQTFLQQVANDPAVPGYVATAYDGSAVFAPTSGQLSEMFEVIASKVLLRLSQ